MRRSPTIRALFLATTCWALAGCPPEDTDSKPVDTGTPPQDTWIVPDDGDGDGITAADGDCDDTNPDIFPGQEEDCNGIDDNCNGIIDEGWPDSDGDDIADCLDEEECDGVDNDGDGEIDEDFPDGDADGTADCVDSEECDGLDNDGDGEIDEDFDADGDGFTVCGTEDVDPDCDDEDSATYPGATEIIGDGKDNDCDQQVDESEWAVGDLVITEIMSNPASVRDSAGEWFEILNTTDRAIYLDGIVIRSDDGAELHEISSDEPIILDSGDLFLLGVDGDASTNGGVEPGYVYSGITFSNESDDLEIVADGLILDTVAWDDGASMPDPDGASLTLDRDFQDGEANNDPTYWCPAPETWSSRSDYGSPGVTNPLCPTYDHDGDGYNGEEGDCDDEDATINPGVAEVWYNGVDQDCDGWSDYDSDQDGHDYYIFPGGDDCDDDNPDVNPSQPEICDDDDTDEDCNGLADDDDPSVTELLTWYPDADGDGYGDDDNPVERCNASSLFSTESGDCDDSQAIVYPGAEEICGDGYDNDCDGLAGDCGVLGDISLSEASSILLGVARDDSAGQAAAGIGDFNDDGYDDILVSAYSSDSADTNAGAAYVFHGPLSGELTMADADLTMTGTNPEDYAGWSLAGPGDMDGDGYPDLLVGAYGNDDAATGAGAAYLLLGPSTGGTISLAQADFIIYGETKGDRAAYDLAAAGDVNGDGYPDLLIGADRDDDGGTDAGAAYIVLGPLTGDVDLAETPDKVYGEAASDWAARSVAGAGDTNGDGFDDILIGARAEDSGATDAGAAYLVLGPATGRQSLADSQAKYISVDANDLTGEAVAGAGDTNNDGYDDFLIGSPGSNTVTSDDGTVYVVLGPVTNSGTTILENAIPTAFTGEESNDSAGEALAGACDVDGDGYDDILVGVKDQGSRPSSAGAAYVLYGPFSGVTNLGAADAKASGQSSQDYAGTAVAGAGDTNADGYPDVLVGVPGDDNSASAAGAIYLLQGGPGF